MNNSVRIRTHNSNKTQIVLAVKVTFWGQGWGGLLGGVTWSPLGLFLDFWKWAKEVDWRIRIYLLDSPPPRFFSPKSGPTISVPYIFFSLGPKSSTQDLTLRTWKSLPRIFFELRILFFFHLHVPRKCLWIN